MRVLSGAKTIPQIVKKESNGTKITRNENKGYQNALTNRYLNKVGRLLGRCKTMVTSKSSTSLAEACCLRSRYWIPFWRQSKMRPQKDSEIEPRTNIQNYGQQWNTMQTIIETAMHLQSKIGGRICKTIVFSVTGARF